MFMRARGFVCCGAAAILCSMIRSEAPCAAGQDPCLCMEHNTLFLTDAKTHGAAVRSVDWCCTLGSVKDTRGNPLSDRILLALGGDPGIDQATARIYGVDLSTGMATEITQNYSQTLTTPQLPIVTGPTTAVNVVTWFCACGRMALALGGCNLTVTNPKDGGTVTGDVLVFDISGVTYDSTTASYKLTVNDIKGYIHGAPVYSLAWVPQPASCASSTGGTNAPLLGFLIVGGAPDHDSNASIDIVPYYTTITNNPKPNCTSTNNYCRPYGADDPWLIGASGGRCGSKKDLQNVLFGGMNDLCGVTAQDLSGHWRCHFDGANAFKIRTGTVVKSLDVFTSSDAFLLVAAGGSRYDSCYAPNVFVYTLNASCHDTANSSSLSASIITQGRYAGGTVNSIRWCGSTASCDPFPLLAIGGCTSESESKNAVIYRISRGRHLREVASTSSTDNGLTCVMSLDWSPTCPCSQLALGGGCGLASTGCSGNLFLYRKNASQPILEKICSANFDSTITSLAWCNAQSRCSLLAVGATGSLMNDDDDDETDNGQDYDQLCNRELGIYKASLCGNHVVCPR